ncbi:homing endonuclease associated repeat-containing protein [Clostridioides difficile]
MRYSKKELIDYLVKYNEEIGYPTQRGINKQKGYPSSVTYFNNFGSFRKALEIANLYDNNKLRYFDREPFSLEEINCGIKRLIEDKLAQNKIINVKDLNNCSYLPASSTIFRKTGFTIDEMYENLGYDKKEITNLILENDMKKKYLELKNILGKMPNNRDLDKYSKLGKSYCASAYKNHFGNLYNLQNQLDINTNMRMKSRRKSKNDLKNDILKLYKLLGRIPTVHDISSCEWCSSLTKYQREFGTYEELLVEINLLPRHRLYYTNKKRLKMRSFWELLFANMLEEYDIEYNTETYYKNVIPNFSTNHRFDFEINLKNKKYYVEIFGLMIYEKYRNKTEWKIDICKKNNINLIDIYPQDFSYNLNELYDFFMQKLLKRR